MIILYIPTTTLNFNNILSSESISPKSFYERREFGYKRWTPTEENNNGNAIVLYDSLPIFERPNNGLEDHPLIVQVAIDENQVKKIGEGVYYSAKTIYLDPWHTRFIFQTESDKRTTLSMSDSSSETKLLRLYRNLMDTRKGEKKYAIPANFNTVLNEEEISHDFTLNRIKGLLYGYYIGANMSLRKKDVKEIVDLRELQNILSSIQSSDDHIPSRTQRERLHDLLGLGLFLYDAEISNGQMLTKVEDSLLQFEQVVANKKEMLLPDSHEIEVVNSHLSSARTIQNDKEQCLFKAWTDFLFSFSSCKYNGKISTINKDLSDEITVIAKTVYGGDWEGSHAKTFLNNLRRHVRGEVFEEQWNNGLLSSIAAVLTHGDDWHKLLLFMQSKGMYDYRLAFAFYGILNGFANLTRDFTDSLLEQDRKYITSVYKDVYKQIFGQNLSVDNSDISNITGESQSHDISSPVALINRLRDSFGVIFKGLKLTKSDKEGWSNALTENDNNENPYVFRNILKKQKGWSKGKKLNAVSDFLNIKEETIGKRKTTFQPDLFTASSSSHTSKVSKHLSSRIISDSSWGDKTASFIHDEEARKQYLKDIDWFIKNHQEKYYDKKKGWLHGKYYGHDTSNERIINRLEAFLNRYKNGANMSWLIPIYRNIPVGRIMAYLREFYGK